MLPCLQWSSNPSHTIQILSEIKDFYGPKVAINQRFPRERERERDLDKGDNIANDDSTFQPIFPPHVTSHLHFSSAISSQTKGLCIVHSNKDYNSLFERPKGKRRKKKESKKRKTGGGEKRREEALNCQFFFSFPLLLHHTIFFCCLFFFLCKSSHCEDHIKLGISHCQYSTPHIIDHKKHPILICISDI